MSGDLARRFPQWGLRVSEGDLVLAPPTDADLDALAALVATPGSILGPGAEEFVTWPVGTGAEAARSFRLFHEGLRAPPDPDRWHVPLTVHRAGRPIGVAGLAAPRWRTEKVVDTRSWLAREEQGRGVGRRVRRMLLVLAVDGLGATAAVSAAAEANGASRRVSESLGYRETGRIVGDDGVREVRYDLVTDAWRDAASTTVTLEGVGPFLAAVTGS